MRVAQRGRKIKIYRRGRKDLVQQGQFNAESTTSEIADCLLDHVAESWDELPDKRSVEERVSEWRLANPATS